MLALQPDVTNVDDTTMPYIYLNNAMLLAKYFDKRQNMKKQPGAYFHIGYPAMYFFYNFLEIMFPRFTGFYTVHGPSPLKRVLMKLFGIWRESIWIRYALILSVTEKTSVSTLSGNIRN